jgi:hypothetical protein
MWIFKISDARAFHHLSFDSRPVLNGQNRAVLVSIQDTFFVCQSRIFYNYNESMIRHSSRGYGGGNLPNAESKFHRVAFESGVAYQLYRKSIDSAALYGALEEIRVRYNLSYPSAICRIFYRCRGNDTPYNEPNVFASTHG